MFKISAKDGSYDQKNNGGEEHKNGKAIHTMHHFKVNILGSVWVFLPEKITEEISQIKKIFKLHFVYASILAGSVQLPSSLIRSINSSTALSEDTDFFTTFCPLYKAILPFPTPTYP